jgi:hypothetical protein
MPTNYVISSTCYIVSVLLDGLDGEAARKYRQCNYALIFHRKIFQQKQNKEENRMIFIVFMCFVSLGIRFPFSLPSYLLSLINFERETKMKIGKWGWVEKSWGGFLIDFSFYGRYKVWGDVGSADRSVWHYGIAGYIKLLLSEIYVLVPALYGNLWAISKRLNYGLGVMQETSKLLRKLRILNTLLRNTETIITSFCKIEVMFTLLNLYFFQAIDVACHWFYLHV